ncbi:hypothetical protein SAMN05444920_11476 [Nonomuraea solani]|uniref:Uncharacterized protein n=1 Tax=Nonomuraea solani TaxID=1144553 RepID=A0A1H6EPK2_9ACTN|nr:hypothetical protein [Nonomuraea solani]SEG99800.1 hypothetical protein SAMN05444920_11476 [Nonomuraea solani]
MARLQEQAGEWEERVREDTKELTHSLPPYVVDAAVSTAGELGRVQPDVILHGGPHPGTFCAPTVSRGRPSPSRDTRACDAGALLKSPVLTLLEADDLGKALHRTLDVFAEFGSALGPVPCRPGRVLGTPPRFPRRAWRSAVRPGSAAIADRLVKHPVLARPGEGAAE